MTNELIVDTNILMSALITPQGRMFNHIIDISKKKHLFASHYVYIEIFHHKEKILKLNKLPESDLLELMLGLLNRIDFVSEEHISKEIWEKAYYFTKDIDLKDISHVALAIFKNAPLWTGDRRLTDHLRTKGFNLIFSLADNL
jgi:predicted nucleic acid-binding protein